jgi:hypothetical protein
MVGLQPISLGKCRIILGKYDNMKQLDFWLGKRRGTSSLFFVHEDMASLVPPATWWSRTSEVARDFQGGPQAPTSQCGKDM